MLMKNKKIILNTKTRFEFIDITGEVEDFISSSGILNGQVLIYSKHTTLAIVINEKETGIFQDSEEFFKIHYRNDSSPDIYHSIKVCRSSWYWGYFMDIDSLHNEACLDGIMLM